MQGPYRVPSLIPAEPGRSSIADDADEWDPFVPVVAPARARDFDFFQSPRPTMVILFAGIAGITFGMALGMAVSSEDDRPAAVSTHQESVARR